MARKPQENPALDMTPMIDVVFELIIFFVVTLTEAQKKDETIELEDGFHGTVITPKTLPANHMVIDVGRYESGPNKGNVRVSMGDRDLTAAEITRRVKERKDKIGEFDVLIRADYETPHAAVAKVLDAITTAGLWKISFAAIDDRDPDKPGKMKPGMPPRPRLEKAKKRGAY